jgi:hypothetical protein
MTIEFLIHMATNCLVRLQEDRILAEARGDLEMVMTIDHKITETELTLSALRSL